MQQSLVIGATDLDKTGASSGTHVSPWPWVRLRPWPWNFGTNNF